MKDKAFSWQGIKQQNMRRNKELRKFDLFLSGDSKWGRGRRRGVV
jgi:hypothetical protein